MRSLDVGDNIRKKSFPLAASVKACTRYVHLAHVMCFWCGTESVSAGGQVSPRASSARQVSESVLCLVIRYVLLSCRCRANACPLVSSLVLLLSVAALPPQLPLLLVRSAALVSRSRRWLCRVRDVRRRHHRCHLQRCHAVHAPTTFFTNPAVAAAVQERWPRSE